MVLISKPSELLAWIPINDALDESLVENDPHAVHDLSDAAAAGTVAGALGFLLTFPSFWNFSIGVGFVTTFPAGGSMIFAQIGYSPEGMGAPDHWLQGPAMLNSSEISSPKE